MMEEVLEAYRTINSTVSLVTTTMIAMLIGLLFHGYWLGWSSRRIDRLRKEIEDIKKENRELRSSINEAKTPFPWLKTRS